MSPSTSAARWSPPAFVDAHVHATDTGLRADRAQPERGGLSRRAARRGGRSTRRPAGRTRSSMGHGWDESRLAGPGPPTAAGARPGRRRPRVYLTQASVHAAPWRRSALLAAAPRRQPEPGFDDTRLGAGQDAHHAVREVAFGSFAAGAAGGGAADRADRGPPQVGHRRGARVRWARHVRSRTTSPACSAWPARARPARGVRAGGAS